MNEFKKIVAILLLILVIPCIGNTNQLSWIEMETKEEIKNLDEVNTLVQPNKKNVISLNNVNQSEESPNKQQDAIVKDDVSVAIEEIMKRRKEEDIMLGKLLAKKKEQEKQQKEQEKQQRELEKKKIVDDVIAATQKQKEEDNNKLASVLREINQQQAKLQSDRDKQQADQNKTLLEFLQMFKAQQENQQQSEQNKQLVLLQSTLDMLKPQHLAVNSSLNVIPLDDPQYAKKSIHQYIAANTQDAKEAPTREADVSFFYSSGALFKIYCKEGFLTDVQLQPGEEIQYINGGDTVRWVVDKAQSGSGNEKIWHIYLKPIQSGLETNIVINTNKHSYQIQAQSTNWYNPIVRWNYPQEEKAAFFRQQENEKKREDDTISMTANSPDKLNFNYNIKGKSYTWSPEVVFDDGMKTYIKMPATLTTGDAPILCIKEKKKLHLVNYRVKNNYYIVDRLFKEAELRVGKDAVRIKQD